MQLSRDTCTGCHSVPIVPTSLCEQVTGTENLCTISPKVASHSFFRSKFFILLRSMKYFTVPESVWFSWDMQADWKRMQVRDVRLIHIVHRPGCHRRHFHRDLYTSAVCHQLPQRANNLLKSCIVHMYHRPLAFIAQTIKSQRVLLHVNSAFCFFL